MAWKVRQGYVDHSREFSASQFYVAESTGDDNAQSISDANAIRVGIGAVTLCNFTSTSLNKVIDTDTGSTPASEQAQREIALWVQYQDDVNNEYGELTIPGPDLALVSQANTDEVDIVSNVTAAALVTVLESNAVSRDGNAITVTRMRIIGRRN